MPSFAFGGHERERIAITVAGYERPASGDPHDDNWLTVHIALQCGAFTGQFDAAFLTHELTDLQQQLQVLYDTLAGSATFTTLEGQLALSFTGDGRGHIGVVGQACDAPGSAQQLQFALEIDQTQLRDALQSLAAVIAAFPARG